MTDSMTNKEVLEIALRQSAYDANCDGLDFLKNDHVIVESKANPKARKYLQLPHFCNFISYGTNVVATIDMAYKKIVEDYLNTYEIEHLFETPNLYALNKAFEPYDIKACFMAEYFLPDVNSLKEIDCDYEMKLLGHDDFKDLYVKEWSNALCKDRSELDVIGVGVYDTGKLIALAGASADCDAMWQIGIDVLPDYRRQNIAAAAVSKLAIEILKKGKVPFYCCAWSNIKSARTALSAGFKPSWVELTLKSNAFIEQMNQK